MLVEQALHAISGLVLNRSLRGPCRLPGMWAPRRNSWQGSSPTVDHGPDDALHGAVLRSIWIPTPWRIVELLMVWIAAGIADASIRGQVVPKVYADRDWPLIGLIEGPVGFHFLVPGV